MTSCRGTWGRERIVGGSNAGQGSRETESAPGLKAEREGEDKQEGERTGSRGGWETVIFAKRR